MSIKTSPPKKHTPKNATRPGNKYTLLALFAVLALTLVSYFPSLDNGFTNWDDTFYVSENPMLPNDKAADFFTKDKFVQSNYHPLTMLSYSMEYHSSQLAPKRYHIDNLLLHLLNTALVYFFIFLLLGGWQGAAITAALFGVHPMHVESVAWVSERKDVLYTFFYLASLIAYIFYTRNKKPVMYAAALVLFILSLFSKGQAVTLPISMLLVDYFCSRKFTAKTFVEKIPFFVLSVVFGITAIIGQQTSNAINVKLGFGFNTFLYAFYGLANYLFKFLLPLQLSSLYPYPVVHNGVLPVVFYIAPIVVTGLGALVYFKFRKNKTVVFGALFFLLNIGPLLQLLPVGGSIMFDRYTYIPYIGLSFIVAQAFMYFYGDGKKPSPYRNAALTIIVLAIVTYAYAGSERCRVWKDSETLWGNVLENYPGAARASNNLGYLYYQKSMDYSAQNKADSAKTFMQMAVNNFKHGCEIEPDEYDELRNLCLGYISLGKADSAIIYTNKMIVLNPKKHDAYIIRGNAYAGKADYKEAIKDYTTGLNMDSTDAQAHAWRSEAYFAISDKKSALADALEAKKLGMQVSDAYLAQLR